MAKAGPTRGRMPRVHRLVRLAASCLLLLSAASSAQAQVTPAQVLNYKPRQTGVQIDTPTDAEQAACKVEVIHGKAAGSSGYVLRGPRNQTLRKLFDSNGDKKVDQWSYYRNGDEVYREIDTNFNDRPDQYRWYNAGGMKWGVDSNEDGKIDAWKMISSEEVAHEAFAAVATKNFDRLRLLFVNDAELQALRLPATEAQRIRNNLQQGSKKFETASGKMPDSVKMESVHIEAASAQCWPADSFGGEQDLLRYPSRTLVFEKAPTSHEWMQTGEMVQVGPAWRLLDVPSIGQGGITPPVDPKMQQLMDQVTDLDTKLDQKASKAEMVRYYLTRAPIVEELVKLTQGNDREIWFKQLADNLSAAAQHSTEKDTAALERLKALRDHTAKGMGNSNMTAYLTYRVLMVEYSRAPSGNQAKAQTEWTEKLSSFVSTYPRADDTPDALIQLGMGAEFSSKDDEAKRWYKQLVTTFPQHLLAPKAEGAIRRLDLVGKPMPLVGKTLNGLAFDAASQKGKVVLVYYWASYCSMCERDFPAIKKLHDDLNSKGFEIVSVNLDDNAQDGLRFLQGNPLPGHHLHSTGEAGGLSSPLAVQYGIMGLPNLFLIGKDGNVINRSIQSAELGDAVRKALN